MVEQIDALLSAAQDRPSGDDRMGPTRTAWTLVIGSLASCVAANFPTAALAADPGVPLMDGMYTAAGCPSGYISGDTVHISTGDSFGGGNDRYIQFEHQIACKLSGLRKSGSVLSGKQHCFSGGTRMSYEVEPSQITLNIADSKTFTLQATSQDGKPLGRLSGKTWRWCR